MGTDEGAYKFRPLTCVMDDRNSQSVLKAHILSSEKAMQSHDAALQALVSLSTIGTQSRPVRLRAQQTSAKAEMAEWFWPG